MQLLTCSQSSTSVPKSLHFFLVERAHQLVAIKFPQNRDPLYLLGIAIVLFGFGVLAVFAFMNPVTSLSQIDEKCRIGLHITISNPLLIDVGYELNLAVFGELESGFGTMKSSVGLLKRRSGACKFAQ